MTRILAALLRPTKTLTWEWWWQMHARYAAAALTGMMAVLLAGFLYSLAGCAPLLNGATGNMVCECRGMWTCDCVTIPEGLR